MACCSPVYSKTPVREVKEVADLVIYGDIVTVAGDNTSLWSQKAVAVKNGLILAVGTVDDVQKFIRHGETEERTLSGTQTLMPGFIDPHVHWALGGVNFYGMINMFGYIPTTVEDIMAELENAVKNAKEGEWICAGGLNPMLVPGMRVPDRKDLDKISTEHPIFIFSAWLHSAYCNSKALALAGIDKNNPPPGVPTGGEIVRDETGEPTGVLKEAPAIEMVQKLVVFVKDDEAGLRILKKAANVYANRGVTTIGEPGFFDGWVGPPGSGSKALMKEVANGPNCPVRIIAYSETTPEESDRGVPGQDNLVFMGQKFLQDGSPFAGTVCLGKEYGPYLDNDWIRNELGFSYPAPYYGRLNFTYDQMRKLMKPAHDGNWQIICHTQGEKALTTVLDVIESLLKEKPRIDHRYRIEHSIFITKDLMKRAHNLGVTLTFLTPQIYWFGYYYKEYMFGKERTERCHPIASAFKEGIRASFHSDEPETPVNPLENMWTAVTRRSRAQAPDGDFPGVKSEVLGPDEIITVEQAIQACTINPAYQMHHEHLIGSIEKGKIADFVILGENPLKVAKGRIRDIEVMYTMKRGKVTARYDV